MYFSNDFDCPKKTFFFFVTSIKIMFKALKYRNENTKIFE